MKYADMEGFEKKDPFKKGFIDLVKTTGNNLLKHHLKIIPESLGEPAALIDFVDYDFYLAYKTDGIGTKSLIADTMSNIIRKNKTAQIRIDKLYSGLGIDLIASNVNDMICLGAIPFALSDEVAAGHFSKFIDKDLIKGLFAGFKKGCMDADITIPCGESPTLVDVVNQDSISITGSTIGIIKPKAKAIFGQQLQAGDSIYGLTSNGIHTNGLSLARKLIEKLPYGYFTKFGGTTIGEELLKPTKIYVKPVLEMLAKNVDIHYMSNISGSAFRKISRARKEFTYVIEQLPKVPNVLNYVQKIGTIPDNEAYETLNMGLGFVIFAPDKEERIMRKICQKYKQEMLKIGYVTKGKKQVIIREKDIIY